LLQQWRDRIQQFLGVTAGDVTTLSNPDALQAGAVVIVMIQAIAHNSSIQEALHGFGHVIVDECHHIPATTFEAVLASLPACSITGLTATPYRKDGLHPIIFMHCGPLRYSMDHHSGNSVERVVMVRNTSFALPDTQSMPLHEVWEQLIADSDRNDQIADDCITAVLAGHIPLLLTDRKDHITTLIEQITMKTKGTIQGILLSSGMGKKEKKRINELFEQLKRNEIKAYVIATGSLIGEGFDFPELDTLILAMPVSFKGRIVQYVGRLHRTVAGKDTVTVYDYCDAMPITKAMFRKRLKGYQELGYRIEYGMGAARSTDLFPDS